jgi:hypothetical protein
VAVGQRAAAHLEQPFRGVLAQRAEAASAAGGKDDHVDGGGGRGGGGRHGCNDLPDGDRPHAQQSGFAVTSVGRPTPRAQRSGRALRRCKPGRRTAASPPSAPAGCSARAPPRGPAGLFAKRLFKRHGHHVPGTAPGCRCRPRRTLTSEICGRSSPLAADHAIGVAVSVQLRQPPDLQRHQRGRQGSMRDVDVLTPTVWRRRSRHPDRARAPRPSGS